MFTPPGIRAATLESKVVEDAGCVPHLRRIRPILMLTRIATIAAVSGLAAGLLPLLQAGKILREQSAAGISLAYLVGGVTNSAIWTTYSFSVRNLALILPNMVTLTTMVALLSVTLAYRRRETSRFSPHRLKVTRPALSSSGVSTADAGSFRPGDADTLILAPLA